mgnify:CR=1 FL=1
MDLKKDIPENVVIAEVKAIIKATGIKLQRINTGCFVIGTGTNRRFVKTADAGTCDFEGYDNIGRFVAIECKRWAIKPRTKRTHRGHKQKRRRGVRST